MVSGSPVVSDMMAQAGAVESSSLRSVQGSCRMSNFLEFEDHTSSICFGLQQQAPAHLVHHFFRDVLASS